MEYSTIRPLISIIVPIYNTGRWLKACLDSILKQQYEYFQLLLINDGSTDESEEISHSYQDERIEYYSIPHSGVAVARNVGLKHAKGKYIAFVDSDDLVHPLFLSTLLAAMINYNADVVGCRWSAIDACFMKFDNQLVADNKSIHVFDGMQAIKECRVSGELNGWGNTVIWNKLFKADIAKGETFDPRFAYGEDTKWLWPVLKKTKRVVLLHDVLYGYRKVNEKKAYLTYKNLDQYYQWEYQYFQDLGMAQNILEAPVRILNKYRLSTDIEHYIEIDTTIKQQVMERWRTNAYKESFPPKRLGSVKLWICMQLIIWGFPRHMVQWVYHLSI